jgi:hypothetical protein
MHWGHEKFKENISFGNLLEVGCVSEYWLELVWDRPKM